MTLLYSDDLRDLSYLRARAAPDLADWLLHLENENKADRTIDAYRLGIAKLLRLNMGLAVEEFSPAELNAWLASYPRKSRHIIRSMGAQFFAWLVLVERIEKNPMDKVARPKAPARPLVDIFTHGERSALMGLERPHGNLMSLLFGSGIRRDEACRLMAYDFDPDRERIHVRHGKGDKPRVVPLLDFALIAMTDLSLDLASGWHVFHKTRGPGYRARWREKHDPRDELSTTAFQRWWQDCIEAARVTYRKPHTTRHTYNEILREENYDLEERQLLLGHASSRTTADIYGHLSIEDVARKMRERA